MFALVLTGIPVAAADPLTQFDSATDVVVRIKSPKSTTEKVATLVDSVQPGFGAMVRQNSPAIGALISNPALAGVDQSKDWYIGIYTNGEEEPSVVFAVPTTDSAAAAAALGESFSSTTVDNWLFYSEDEGALPTDEPAGRTILDVMRGEPKAVFDRGDVSVFVNIANLTEAYADQIAAGREQFEAQLEMAGSQIPATPGMDMEAVLAVQREVMAKIFTGIEDAEQLTIIANVEKDGVVFEDYLSFAPESATAGVLADHPRSDLKLASKMPADSVVIFGASANMQKLMELGMSFSQAMFKENEAAKQGLAEFEKLLKEVQFGGIVGAVSLGSPESGLFRTVSVMEVNPAERFKEISRKMSETTGTVEANGFKQETTIQRDAETVGDVKVDIVTVKQEFDENADPTGMAQQMQAMMFGPDGMQTRVAYVQDKVIQTLGGGADAMAAVLKSLNSSGPVQPPTFRKGLIPNPNVLVLVDIPGLAIQGLKAASAIPGIPIPINTETLDSIKLEKSFVGFSAAADKNAVRVKSRVPVEQIQSLIAVVMFVQQMQAGQ
jgi:hypothetical protein